MHFITPDMSVKLADESDLSMNTTPIDSCYCGTTLRTFVVGMYIAALGSVFFATNLPGVPITYKNIHTGHPEMTGKLQSAPLAQNSLVPQRFNLDSVAAFSFSTNPGSGFGSDCYPNS